MYMSSQDKKAVIARPKVFICLAVVVVVGCLLLSTLALWSRFQAWNAKKYCEAVLASGDTFGAEPDDYTSQLTVCERNPSLAPI
jgi:hypothetical protein